MPSSWMVKNTPGRPGDQAPPVMYEGWYLVVMIGVRRSSVLNNAEGEQVNDK